MGHRLSKTPIPPIAYPGNFRSQKTINPSQVLSKSSQSAVSPEPVDTVPAINSDHLTNADGRSIINLITDGQHFCLSTESDLDSVSSGRQQIVIKIQLAKMESDKNTALEAISSSTDDALSSNNNLNVQHSNVKRKNMSFRRNIACNQRNDFKPNNVDVTSSPIFNNNFVNNLGTVPYIEENGSSSSNAENGESLRNLNRMMNQMGNCQITKDGDADVTKESGSNRSSTGSSEFSDVTPETIEINKANGNELKSDSESAKTNIHKEESKHHCCRRKKSTTSSPVPESSTVASSSTHCSKWRCCKCTCRDALKKLRPSGSRKHHHLSVKNNAVQIPTASTSSNEISPSLRNQLAIWSPPNDIIIPLPSPQIVVVQYPAASNATHVVTLGPIANIDEHTIRLMTGDLAVPSTPDSPSSMAVSPCSTPTFATTPNGSVVHSQVDYIHCLVPDLERITKSTFYWGKMDRYEAERLLEGKPEGTFLLRDSAQEEYLFSVTFRKYGRSLHARIEQFNHRFSFDCHDPGVFTARTVTGLLEHYKDPSCVLFFEPMLTIPLHRNKPFSLQQLCRGTIVSHTTYDGISELDLPTRLKSFLKEYHYKQRVRIKPFDEAFYSCI